MKRNSLTLVIGLLLILIFGLLLFTFQVRTSEVAVVTTFGKPTREIAGPANYLPYFKWPWPIQRVYKFDQRVQNFEDKLTEGYTSDNFNLLTSVYVGWQITEPTNFFPRFAGASEPIAEAERLLDRELGRAKIAVVGKHPLSDLISPSNEANKFAQIEDEIRTAIQTQVRAHNYGLDIVFLGLKKLQLPESVTQSVFERMQSERKVLAEKSQAEGEAEAQKIRSEAERKATELLANADSQATQIRGLGEAEAAKSLAVFQQNPRLANLIFGLNALEGSLKEHSTLIFDQHTPPFDLFWGVSTNLFNQ
jgi:modulator of FtsH protease HflC